jgi:hypothetical protein
MQIRQARTLGLAQQPDLLTLALFHLMLHPRLHEHAGVRSVIKQAVQEQRRSAPCCSLQRQRLEAGCGGFILCRSLSMTLGTQFNIAIRNSRINGPLQGLST